MTHDEWKTFLVALRLPVKLAMTVNAKDIAKDVSTAYDSSGSST